MKCKGYEREQSCSNLRYYASIFLVGLKRCKKAQVRINSLQDKV